MSFIAIFDRFEFELSGDAIADCSLSGDVSESVEYWSTQIDLSHISDDALSEQLSEYGAWSDSELADRKENELRIIWIAACDAKENEVLQGE